MPLLHRSPATPLHAGHHRAWRIGLALLCALIAAPGMAADTGAVPALQRAQQLILVLAPDWDSPQGQLQAFERDAQGWRTHGQAFDVSLGRHGSAWGLGLHPAQHDGPQKREGDGRSPAGVFTIGEAFGYASRIDSAMPYQAMQESNYCIDVPTSPLYNRIVDAKDVGSATVAGSTEPMRLDLRHDGDMRYREGFVIQHNAQATPGAGSCIFAHLWRAPGAPTAGCTAMQPADMQGLLAWLRPSAAPLFVLLPRDAYRRLQADWSLPAVEPAP
ncbi:L,D-transpeptidase family protein [Xanthomonas sacchari]|uniref:L,D-transpeptidase family protein n=1 Tax=Xanthomonas sacchari TaxID=56458 RepID=UPI0020C24F59|nr:L,D-transpeptidase family protein [Xanthomonas sacchari]